MADNKLKKPGKVGGKKTTTGVVICLVLVLVPFMVAFGVENGLPGLFKEIVIFGQMNPIFAFALLVCMVMGGLALGKLMKGGTRLGDTSQVSDLDKL